MQFLILDLTQPRLALTPQGDLLMWKPVPAPTGLWYRVEDRIPSSGHPHSADSYDWRPVVLEELPEAAMAELLQRLERCIPLEPGSLSGEALPAVLAACAATMRRMAGALAEAA